MTNDFVEKTMRNKEFQGRRKERQRVCDKDKEEEETPPFVFKISEEEFMKTVKAFEERNKSLTYKRCTGCRKVQMGLKLFNVTDGNSNHQLCSMCKSYASFLDKIQCTLPIWFNVNGKNILSYRSN